MSKEALLNYLARTGKADAIEMAADLGMRYPAAAMALLRLLRQGLVARYLDPDAALYWYELTPKGQARLRYFRRFS